MDLAPSVCDIKLLTHDQQLGQKGGDSCVVSTASTHHATSHVANGLATVVAVSKKCVFFKREHPHVAGVCLWEWMEMVSRERL